MPSTQTGIGIDIGAHALKGVVLRKRGTHVALTRAATLELGDLAFLEDSDRKDRRIAELLRLLVRRGRIRGGPAAAGLAGHDYFVKYLHVPPTTPDKLRKLIEYETSEDPTASSKEQTHDFLLLDLPSRAEEFTVLVVMARDETLRRHLALLRRGGVKADGLTLDAIALFNAYVNARDEEIYNEKTTLLVDIGAQHMDVAVQRNAKLLFVRNLTLGGNRFTEAVQDEFHLPLREAEELKITQGALLPTHFDVAAELDTSTPEARLSAALLEPAENVYNTLQATIKYCQTQTRMPNLKIDEVVLSGRCAHLRGLRDFLAHRFRVPVEIFDPLARMDTSALAPDARAEAMANAPSYSVAIGLALRELDERRVRPITLLPETVRHRRAFFQHTFFLYAAAAVFALAFAAMVYCSTLATAQAQQEVGIKRRLISEAETMEKQLKRHQEHNARLAGHTGGLKRVLDTGRRCCEAIAVLRETTPPQLIIDSISATTERPALVAAKGVQPEPTTHLVVEGRVCESHGENPISIMAAQHIVDNFLASLLERKHLYSRAKVTKYPDAREPEGRRTFKMDVFFSTPFAGG
ncbi:MAG TPA: type IV pilus assembly protein PilM [Planctomycetota bacterium]|nr:type IV pilus assembly protein PilM [Planctomycetota bacterium]